MSERKTVKNSLLEHDDISSASTYEDKSNSMSASSNRKANPLRASMVGTFTGSSAPQQDNVKVIIRVRPTNEREKRSGGPGSSKVDLCLAVENTTEIVLDRGASQKTFTFDFVAKEDSEQADLFEVIARPIADQCLQGYNGTIFAYGQTGSGKTFTI